VGRMFIGILSCPRDRSHELKKYVGSVYFPINNRDYRAMVRKAIDAVRNIGIVVTPGELKVLDSGSNMVKLDEVYLKIGLFVLAVSIQRNSGIM